MNQRADSRGALHRIREPGVQRELGGLPDGPAEQEEGNQGEQLGVQQADPRGDLIEPDRAELALDNKDGNEEEDVSDAVNEDRLLRGSRRFRLVVPKSDQQIRAEAHDLPENQELQEVVCGYSAEHRRREQTHLGVVARLALLLVHVSERIDKNQETEERHEDKHEGAQVVDQNRDPDLVPRDARKPDVAGDGLRREVPAEPSLHQDLDEDVQREAERTRHRAGDNITTACPEPSSHQSDQEECAERKEKDEPDDPGVRDHGSPFQDADLVEFDRAVGLVDRKEDREPDRGLRGGHRNPEEGEHLTTGVSAVRREGDEVQDRGVQEDLDRHEDDDRVSAGEDAVQADAEQRGREEELVLEGDHGPTLPGSSILAK